MPPTPTSSSSTPSQTTKGHTVANNERTQRRVFFGLPKTTAEAARNNLVFRGLQRAGDYAASALRYIGWRIRPGPDPPEQRLFAEPNSIAAKMEESNQAKHKGPETTAEVTVDEIFSTSCRAPVEHHIWQRGHVPVVPLRVELERLWVVGPDTRVEHIGQHETRWRGGIRGETRDERREARQEERRGEAGKSSPVAIGSCRHLSAGRCQLLCAFEVVVFLELGELLLRLAFLVVGTGRT